jgi:Zn-dependent peptidase ImmA (M78 family)
MEYQANHIAPRILMPVQTVKRKIEELYTKYGYYDNEIILFHNGEQKHIKPQTLGFDVHERAWSLR